MKKKKYFNRIEAKILRVLYQQKLLLTIYEVAKECNISYLTAKKYLGELTKEGLIKEEVFPYGRPKYTKKENTKKEG